MVTCEHCGLATNKPVAKIIDGRELNFCCHGCLNVYEFLREEGLLEQVKPEDAKARK
ncbi:MAG: heavy metal translocating P-type ATPase metal-binding domain-containing protein [Chloroflexi bacterium]|nr:heavy metal translocating P-type ATPase metal-binding domain-containing protein [Chloroflexota bacterium]